MKELTARVKDPKPWFSIPYSKDNSSQFAVQAWEIDNGDSWVQVWNEGRMDWFIYPSYKIFNVVAHLPELIREYVEWRLFNI